MPALPVVSVVMPTLNSEKYLEQSLGALRDQDYPADRVEIIIADGGSVDATRDIAHRFGVDRILENPLKTGEAGKAVGVRAARGDLVLLLDSDNVIVGRDWLKRMVAPFDDPDVISAEAMRWYYAREDHYINRYQALSGSVDPVALFVGNYFRDSLITGTYTGCPIKVEKREGWERVRIDPANVPALGANGYVVRRSAFDAIPIGDYLFDIDHAASLVKAGNEVVARVDVDIRHYFCDSVSQFARKQRRRVDDFHYFSAVGERNPEWNARSRFGIVRFALWTVLIVPVAFQSVRGAIRRPDRAWLFHVPACWITLAVYAHGVVRGRLRPAVLDRSSWSQ